MKEMSASCWKCTVIHIFSDLSTLHQFMLMKMSFVTCFFLLFNQFPTYPRPPSLAAQSSQCKFNTNLLHKVLKALKNLYLWWYICH